MGIRSMRRSGVVVVVVLLALALAGCETKTELALSLSMKRFADAAGRGDVAAITSEFSPLDDELRLSNKQVNGKPVAEARKQLRVDVAKLVTAQWPLIRQTTLSSAQTRKLPASADEWARERERDARDWRVMESLGEVDPALLADWRTLLFEREAITNQRLAQQNAAAVDAGAGKILLVARDEYHDLTACLREALVMELSGDWTTVREEPPGIVRAAATAVVRVHESYSSSPHTFVFQKKQVTEPLVDKVTLEVTVVREGRNDVRFTAETTAAEAGLRDAERNETFRQLSLTRAACPLLQKATK